MRIRQINERYKWQARKALVEHIAADLGARPRVTFGADQLEEFLTDLSRSGSWLENEARSAISNTTDNQFYRLWADVSRATIRVRRCRVLSVAECNALDEAYQTQKGGAK